MVPAISVRQQTLNKNVLQDKVLKEVLRYNPEVVFDFYVAKQIDEKLKLLNKPAAAHPLGIVQAYFISESGVILLRQLTTNKSYENTFPPNTLFMDRLYFWGAINPDEFSRPKYEGGPLKFATEPYIDLGGNGVVITFSQRVELPNMRNGVICVDVALPIGTESEIEKRLKDLEAVVLPNTFISEERRFENTLPADFQWLNQPAVVDGPTSRITGAIAFESDFLKRGDVSTDDQVVRFTVPITSAIRFNGSKKTTATKLLLVTFDFRSTGKWIFWSSLGFAAGIGLFMVVAANLLWKFVELGHQMDRVLEKMSTVMYDATTPFIWLNEKNEFVKVNVSFLHALGCDTEHELLNHARRFKDLVTAESAPDYEDKLERSARGEPTPKYQIEIKKVTGEKISVWVHGEGVPSARLGRRRPPHRFGVFLPEPKPDHASPK